MNNLPRRYFKNDAANKYHIDCGELEKNPNSIPVILEKVIKNKNDITILESIIRDKNITSNQKHIVVKIGKVNKSIMKEYQIGRKLQEQKIYGFINFMCLFKCFDDIYDKIVTSEENKEFFVQQDTFNFIEKNSTVFLDSGINEINSNLFYFLFANKIKNNDISYNLFEVGLFENYDFYHDYHNNNSEISFLDYIISIFGK